MGQLGWPWQQGTIARRSARCRSANQRAAFDESHRAARARWLAPKFAVSGDSMFAEHQWIARVNRRHRTIKSLIEQRISCVIIAEHPPRSRLSLSQLPSTYIGWMNRLMIDVTNNSILFSKILAWVAAPNRYRDNVNRILSVSQARKNPALHPGDFPPKMFLPPGIVFEKSARGGMEGQELNAA